MPPRSGVAVDVGHLVIHVGLSEVVEGGSLGQNHSNELVITLDAGLLAGGTGIALINKPKDSAA